MRAVESEKCYTVTFRAAAEHSGPESVTQKERTEKLRGSYLSELSVQWPVMATDCREMPQWHFKRSEGIS